MDAPRTNLAHLEFRYQVLDKNFKLISERASIDAITPNPVFDQTNVVVRNSSFPDPIYFHMAVLLGDAPGMSISSKQLNDSADEWSNQTFESPLPTATLMESWIFDRFHLHMIYIQAL